jgi:hypothetical protein
MGWWSPGRPRLILRLALAVSLTAATLAGAAAHAPPRDVAVVVGKPIERRVFDHWMVVTAKSANRPDTPTIVPADPPRFTRCVARVRAVIPSLRQTRTRVLRSDCAKLFTALSRPVLDLLIKVDWQDDEAGIDGIVVSPAAVDRAYELGKRQNFPSRLQFRRYLRRTGETIADVKFRVRADLTHEALLKAEHLTAAALDAELANRFKPRTSCARFFVMADCAGG